jgi:hypothetical protein
VEAVYENQLLQKAVSGFSKSLPAVRVAGKKIWLS